jgi:hypothetical protein
VYLDDRSCYKILHFAGYNNAERGRFWHHEFDKKGGVKPYRRNRGRPALTQDGSACEVKTGPTKTYRFRGAADTREVNAIVRELDAQAKDKTLTCPAPPVKKSIPNKSKPKRKVSDESSDSVNAGCSKGTSEDSSLTFNDKGNKKPRFNDQTVSAISTTLSRSSKPPELKATVVSLQDRARITSDALLDLQKRNMQLDSSLKSQHILYRCSSVDLASASILNNELMSQLREKAAKASTTMQKDMEIAALRNQGHHLQDYSGAAVG